MIKHPELVQKVLDFVRETEWDTLPSLVQHQAKRCFMDSLGALLAGGQTPVAKMMSGFAAKQFAGKEATIIGQEGHNMTASFVGAALANGHANNAVDIDDGHWAARGHPGGVLLPALLAMVEMPQAKKDGKAFLTALVVGYETASQSSLELDAIDRIVVKTFKYATNLPCTHPRTTEDAQYNMAYPVAAALLDGKLGPQQILPPRIFDKAVLDLTDKLIFEVVVEEDGWLTEQYYLGQKLASLTIRTNEGHVLESGPMAPPWAKEHPPTDKDERTSSRFEIMSVARENQLQTFTRSQVRTINVENFCLIIFDNKIYNVAQFLDKHPGGPEVLIEHLGWDGTESFDSVSHSKEAILLRESFLVGYLIPEPKVA